MYFYFIAPSPTEIYTLSLHDALPIFSTTSSKRVTTQALRLSLQCTGARVSTRSEEHTSELQSHSDIVCRLLLEKKKDNRRYQTVRNRLSAMVVLALKYRYTKICINYL